MSLVIDFLLNVVRKYPTFFMILILGLFAGWVGIKWNELQQSKIMINDLEAKIESIRSAEALTEKLRTDNAKLDYEMGEIQKDVDVAQGRDTPLPVDIRNALRRLRQP